MEEENYQQKIKKFYEKNQLLVILGLSIFFLAYELLRKYEFDEDILTFYLLDILSNLSGFVLIYLLINLHREKFQKGENRIMLISLSWLTLAIIAESLSNNSSQVLNDVFTPVANILNFGILVKIIWFVLLVGVLKIAEDKFEEHREMILASLFAIPILILFLLPALEAENTRFYLDTFTRIFIFAAFALTLNLEIGYLGLPNFGKVAFMAIGGYTYALVEFNNVTTFGSVFVTGFIYAFFVTGFFGVVMTIPTLRLREDYFAIVTIVGGEILRIILLNEVKWTQGHGGIGITNVFYENKEVDQVMENVFLGVRAFTWIILVLSLEYLVYKYYFPKHLKHFDEKKSSNYAFQKVISISVILSSISIFMNYSNVLVSSKDSPSLALDIFSILMPILFIGFTYFNIGIGKVNILFGSLATVFSLSFIFGLITGNDSKSNINNVNWYFMLFALFFMLIVFIIMQELYYSPFGRTLRAIREDDTSAISVGKNLFNFRLKGLFISNALTGVIGAIYALSLFHITPDNYRPILTFQLYIMVIIGGKANNKGVIYGAVLIQILFNTTRKLSSAENRIYYPFFSKTNYLDMKQIDPFNLSLIIVGMALVIFLIYAPGGIFKEKSQNNDRYTDLLYLNDEDPEKIQDDLLLQTLIKLSRSNLDNPIQEGTK